MNIDYTVQCNLSQDSKLYDRRRVDLISDNKQLSIYRR